MQLLERLIGLSANMKTNPGAEKMTHKEQLRMYDTTLDTLFKLSSMSDTFQFATWPLIKPWSVAEHSYYVSICSMFLLEVFQKAGYCEYVDKGELLSKALIHDIEDIHTYVYRLY